MRSISPNVTIAADPRLLFPVSLPGSSTDTPNNRVSHNVVNSLKQRLVTSSLARDSLRIRNTQLRKYSLSKQQKLEKEVKDLKLSHNELVSKLNESQHQNEILGHQHAQTGGQLFTTKNTPTKICINIIGSRQLACQLQFIEDVFNPQATQTPPRT
jgi:hypothetical protein